MLIQKQVEPPEQDQNIVSNHSNLDHALQNEYDPDKIPFDLEEAMIHREASRIGAEIDLEKIKDDPNQKVCQCCGFYLNSEKFDITVSSTQFAHLGPSIPLFFQVITDFKKLKFIEYSIGILFIIFCISSIHALILNFKGNKCEILSKTDIINTSSTSNRQANDDDNLLSSILNLVTTIVCLFFVLFYRKMEKLKMYEIDKSDVSVSDFTLLVQKIPATETSQQIKDFFESLSDIMPNKLQIKVSKINLVYDVEEYFKWYQEYLKLKKISQNSNPTFNLQQQNRLLELQQKIKQYIIDCQDESSTVYFNEAAFISFENEKMKQAVKKHFEYTNLQKYFYWLGKIIKTIDSKKLYKGDSMINVTQAPEPGDINWQNIGLPTYKKIKIRIITIILTIGILVGFFFLILYISQIQQDIQNNNSNMTYGNTILLSVGSSAVILGVNILLSIILRVFSVIEKYSSLTSQSTALVTRLTLAQFINTAIIILVVNLTFNKYEFMIDGGLVSGILLEKFIILDITMVLLLNMFFTPLMKFIDPVGFIFKTLQQLYYITRKHSLTQSQANKLFEKKKFSHADNLATIIKTLLIGTFYSYLIPLAPLICIISLLFNYLMDKYLLVSRYSYPDPIGEDLILEIIKNFTELIFLTFSVGCFIFESFINLNVLPPTIAQLILSIIIYILPVDTIFQSCIISEDYEELETYNQSKQKLKFIDDYDRRNPITQAEALKEYLEYEIKYAEDKDEKKKNMLIKQLSQIQEVKDDQILGYIKIKKVNKFTGQPQQKQQSDQINNIKSQIKSINTVNMFKYNKVQILPVNDNQIEKNQENSNQGVFQQ